MKTIHLLPTDKPSRLLKTIPKGNLLLHKENVVGSHWENQKIYITNSEEIKEGFIEWFICHHGVKKCVGTIVRNNEVYLLDYLGNTDRGIWCKKIVITDNEDLVKDGVQAIDDEFLQWFVKNPSCEFVEIVKEKIILGKVAGTTYTDFNYKIIIPKEEPKPHSFCETPEEKCTMNYCDENGCLNRKRELVEPKQEIWKDIPNYESLYQVSNFGNVKSLERYVKGKVENRLQKENILSKRLVGGKGNQYYSVTLCNNKDRKQIKVSVLVAMAFLNHIPNGYIGLTVDHIDNNPLNNNINNLQVITKRENSSKDRKGISKYTGVTFNKKSNKWRSQIWIDGKNKTLGSFDDELEAHRAYQKELQQHLKS